MANMNLVTGYAGENHVTAADAGSLHAGIVGNGEYILNRGQKLAATIVTNNKLRILDGDLVMQGRHVRIDEGNYVDLTIENGATGYNRHDLVVARYTKDASSGVETVNLVVVKGTSVTGTAEDPAYTSGDIINEAVSLNEMPLYRVVLNGLNIVAVELLATEINSLDDVDKKIKEINAGKVAVADVVNNLTTNTSTKPLSAAQGVALKALADGKVGAATLGLTLDASAWDGDGTYTQTVSVHSVTANNIVIVSPVYASQSLYYSCGVGASAQAAGSLTFSASAKPSDAVYVNVLILE